MVIDIDDDLEYSRILFYFVAGIAYIIDYVRRIFSQIEYLMCILPYIARIAVIKTMNTTSLTVSLIEDSCMTN